MDYYELKQKIGLLDIAKGKAYDRLKTEVVKELETYTNAPNYAFLPEGIREIVEEKTIAGHYAGKPYHCYNLGTKDNLYWVFVITADHQGGGIAHCIFYKVW